MKTSLNCPQGHTWQIEPSAEGATHACPACGAAALGPNDVYTPETAPPQPPDTVAPRADPFRTVLPTPADLQDAETVAPSDASTTKTVSARRPYVPGYQLLAELGRGGMGVVYKARHRKLDRLVALKMILAGGHAGAAELERFRIEAQAIARLQHPHIVQVHEVGEHDGLPYFALEYCSGGTLAHKLAGTPLPPKEAAALVATLARAMHAAHLKGILHRDLKPANVLLAEDGTPKITDFGLAKKLDEAGQTASGAVMGTPSYMAPEQAGGKSGEMGPASDVYALGAILYECLTGRPPFKAATPLDTIMQVVGEEPVPVRQLNAHVPRDLETVCVKCLQKEAGKRYASAQALAEDLRRFCAGEPIVARPVSAAERAAKWAKRKPAQAGVLAVSTIALSVLVLGGLAFTQELRTAWGEEKQRATELASALGTADAANAKLKTTNDRLDSANTSLKTTNDRLDSANTSLKTTNVQLEAARQDAEKKRQQAEDEKQIAQAVRTFLQHDLLRQADPTDQANRVLALGGHGFATIENPTIKELLDRAATELTPKKIEEKFPKQPLVQASILQTVGNTYRGAGDFAKAVAHLERARALYQARLGPHHRDTLNSMNDLAEGYRAAGKLDLAVSLYEETLKLTKAILGIDHPYTLTSMNNLALGYDATGKEELALTLYEETLKRMKAKLGPHDLNTLNCMGNLAAAYWNAHKLDLALPLFEETLKLRKAKLGPDHPDTLMSMHNLASGYQAIGRLDLALPLYEETLKLKKAKLGTDHPDTLRTMNSLAVGYKTAGKLDQALRLYEATVKLRKAKLGPDHPDTLMSMDNLASGYGAAGKLDLALPLYEETLELMKAKLGLDHRDTLICMSNLASGYRAVGRTTASRYASGSRCTSSSTVSNNSRAVT